MRWMIYLTLFAGVGILNAQSIQISPSKLNKYDYTIVKEWLNSYPYLYKGFTPNKGQLATTDGKVANDVLFYSRNGNVGIYITQNGLSYVIYGYERKENEKATNEPLMEKLQIKPQDLIIHYSRIDYKHQKGEYHIRR